MTIERTCGHFFTLSTGLFSSIKLERTPRSLSGNYVGIQLDIRAEAWILRRSFEAEILKAF